MNEYYRALLDEIKTELSRPEVPQNLEAIQRCKAIIEVFLTEINHDQQGNQSLPH